MKSYNEMYVMIAFMLILYMTSIILLEKVNIILGFVSSCIYILSGICWSARLYKKKELEDNESRVKPCKS